MNGSPPISMRSLNEPVRDSLKSSNSQPTGVPQRPPRTDKVPNVVNYRGKKMTEAQEKMLAISGVSFGPIERATKETGKWDLEMCRLKIAKQWFSEGGMRRSYRAAELEADGSSVKNMVVKLFKDDRTKENVIFHEALTQAIAAGYAVAFNNLCERKGLALKVKFLDVFVLKLHDRRAGDGGELYATMEPFLPGKYVKLSDNSGRHLDDLPSQAAQSFSHYTYLASGRRLVCVDIQGVIDMELPVELGGPSGSKTVAAKQLTLTDPQIHSLDGNLFGAGNLGINGINMFIQSYKRTTFDEKLGFAPLTLAPQVQVPQPVALKAPDEDHACLDTAELAKQFQEGAKFDSDSDEEGAESVTPLVHAPPVRANHVGPKQGLLSPFNPEDSMKQFSKEGEIYRLSMRARTLVRPIEDFL